MPLYKYKCRECHNEFRLIDGINGESVQCPECGGHAEREKVNSFSSRYSGSGFYETDYGSDKSE